MTTTTTLASAAQTTDWTPLGNDIVGARYVTMSRDGKRLAATFRSSASNYTIQIYELVEQRGDDNGQSSSLQWKTVGQAIDDFGESPRLASPTISGDGNRIFVRARGEFARVYEYSTNEGLWKPLGQDILPPVSDIDDLMYRFPQSIDISHTGHRIVLSYAPEISLLGSALYYEDIFGLGRVWIYEYNVDTKEWQQIGQTLSDQSSPWFGALARMSGDGKRVAVGQGKEIVDVDGERKISITIRVFEERESGTSSSSLSPWQSMGPESLDALGIIDAVSLSFDGSIAALGTKCEETDTFILDICVGDVGRARVMKYSGDNDVWVQLGQELVGQVGGDNFGRVSLDSNGECLAIGANGEAYLFAGQDHVGRVVTFAWNNSIATWIQDGELVEDKGFGDEMDISWDGSRLFVEANDFARVYSRTVSSSTKPVVTVDPPNFDTTKMPATAPPTAPPTSFGRSLAPWSTLQERLAVFAITFLVFFS